MRTKTASLSFIGSAVSLVVPDIAWAAGSGPNYTAISMFGLFVGLTLVITYWAARRTTTTSDFYAAGGRIGGAQNGLAIAGDFMSAATFLGISGLTYIAGFDAMLFIIGGTLGWAVILFLVAERLRNLGRYTFADVAAYRLKRAPIRTMAACGTLAVAIPYLLTQMVGAGALVQALFGISYPYAVLMVGILMTLYVSFGGMIATTWVQIVKAVLLLIGGSILGLGVMYLFKFNFGALVAAAVEAHPRGLSIMRPGGLYTDPVSVLSVALAFICGTAGLPHILMRFFTVPDAKQARRSVGYALGFIGYFMGLIFVVGLGAIVMVSGNPEFLGEDGHLIGGNNMVAVHLSGVVGGDYFLGFISAVAFATILAVVSGLTLSAASAVSHDLYANVFKHGVSTEKGELMVSRIATIVIGAVAIGLSLLFEGQNVGVLATFVLAIAASVNFPVLFLSMYWKGLTTRGAIAGGSVGLLTSLVLMILSPTVWVEVLGHEKAIYPYAYPTLFSVTASFFFTWLFSVTDKSKRAQGEAEAFEHQLILSEIGSLAGSPRGG